MNKNIEIVYRGRKFKFDFENNKIYYNNIAITMEENDTIRSLDTIVNMVAMAKGMDKIKSIWK